MKNYTYILVGLLLGGIFVVSACNNPKGPTIRPIYSNAVYVVNEGPFDGGTGTIDIYYRELLEGESDIFGKNNGRPLGNVAQSMTVLGDKGYIVINNANKIEVVGLKDFKSIETIENIESPRYLVPVDLSRGYLSCWDNTVKVIDLLDYTIIRSIPVGSGPDQMLSQADRLYVLNSGGFEKDSTMSVINTLSDAVVQTITVGHRPSGIAKDAENNIWILSSGFGWNGFPAADDTKGQLVRYSTSKETIDRTLEFPSTEIHPERLLSNNEGDRVYYLYDGSIYRFIFQDNNLEQNPFYQGDGTFYGLGYDPQTTMLYASDAMDFVQRGKVYVIRENAIMVDIFDAGIIPGNFAFTE